MDTNKNSYRKQSFKNYITIIIIVILLMGFMLRIIPFLQGYTLLIGGDAKRDLVQTLYILQNGAIDWKDSYGAFPVLHLLVATASIIFSLDPELVSSFLPQLVTVLGLVFFYFLLREYFDLKISLLGLFFAAVFGPTIWWSAQGVRETIGLALLPLQMDFLSKSLKEDKVLHFICLYIVTIVLIFTHHWATFIVIITTGIFILYLYKRNVKAWAYFFSMLILSCLWWLIVMPFLFHLFEKALLIASTNPFLIFILLVIVSILFLFIFEKIKIPSQTYFSRVIESITTDSLIFVLFYTSIFCIAVVLLTFASTFLVFEYPIQEYLSIFALFYLSGIGVILSLIKMEKRGYVFIFSSIALFGIIISGFFIGGNYVVFDPLRVIEFLPFYLAPFAAGGVVYFYTRFLYERVNLLIGLLCILAIFGLLIYPPIFLMQEHLNSENIFFDIRDYIKYTPPEGIAALDWAENRGIYLYSQNYEHTREMDILFFNIEPLSEGYLSSVYDNIIMDSKSKIQITDISYWAYDASVLIGKNKVYSNDWGDIYV